MDIKNRSPSFFRVKLCNTTAEKKKSPNMQKIVFKPMPSIQLLESLNMYSPDCKQSTVKKLTVKPERTGMLNLDEFTSSSKKTSKNVRKKLWSVEKTDSKIRRGTVMKPLKETVRNSIYGRSLLAQPKNYSTKKQHAISMDDTLPLTDMEQYGKTKLKRSLFTVPQPKTALKYNTQRNTVSNINIAKPVSVATNVTKKIPKIVITPVPKNKRSSIKNSSNSKQEKEKERKQQQTMLEEIFKKLVVIEEKLESFEEIKSKINSTFLCENCGCGGPFNPCRKQIKNSSVVLQSIEENEQEFENCKLSQCVTNETSSTPSHAAHGSTNKKVHFEKPKNSETKLNLIDDGLYSSKSILNIEETKDFNTHVEDTIIPITKIVDSAEMSLKHEGICTPKTDHMNPSSIESTIKVKKTWIAQFELLENKLSNNSNVSINLNSSSDDSPRYPLLIDNLISDDNEAVRKLHLLKKSPSASAIEGSESVQKNVLFKSRSQLELRSATKSQTDLISESICVYNEMRDDAKFLYTPVVNKTLSFMTPNLQGSQKKIISRRVQEQLLRLNENDF